MRYPLFLSIRSFKGWAGAPAEIRHSGILSAQWARSKGIPTYLFKWHAPSGVSVIYEICRRIFRQQPPKRPHDIAPVLARIARSIYDSPTQLAHFTKRELGQMRSGCFDRDTGFQRLCQGPDELRFFPRTIQIEAAKTLPCRWCGKQVFYREAWKDYKRQVRCNSKDCRRIDYLQHTPTSRGGIDLTPSQRRSLDPPAWGTQKTINYFLLVLKEIKRGRNPNHDVR